MAAKGGLGRGLNGGGKGINSLIPPLSERKEQKIKTDATSEKTKKKETVSTGRISKGKASVKNVDTAEPKEKLVEAEKTVEVPADQYLKIADLEPNREQPRRMFDEEALLELADSIRQYGVLNPVLVQKKGDYYEIIAGERRWRAAKLAGLKEVPVVIKSFTDREAVEVSLIENIQREDLNPMEEAQAFKRLIEEFGLKQEEVAERVSKSRTAITNSMRLLKLDARIQEMLIDQSLSAGHARALLGLEDAEMQYSAAQRVVRERLSVRDTEKLVKSILAPKKKSVSKNLSPELSVIYRDLADKMTAVMGTKVLVNSKAGQKGRIEISYHSNEELERISELIISAGLGNQ